MQAAQIALLSRQYFDTPDAKEVYRYRQFRDKYLMKNKLGRLFIKVYYYIGPWLAIRVTNNSPLKSGLRKVLRATAKILPRD